MRFSISKINIISICAAFLLASNASAANKTYLGTIDYNPITKKINSTCNGINDAWINNYQFASNLHEVKAGNFDGTGYTQFVITSSQGIAVVKKSGNSFVTLCKYPNSTQLGSWYYNYSSNVGADRIAAIGDFNNDTKDEILITNGYRVGILSLTAQNALTSLWTASNGTRLSGGWLINTADTKFVGVGDLNGDVKKEIVVESPWGYGVWALNGSTVTSPRYAYPTAPCSGDGAATRMPTSSTASRISTATKPTKRSSSRAAGGLGF